MAKAVAKKPAAPRPPDLVVHDDIQQGTDEWRALRLGLVTASELSTVMAGGDEQKTRTKLMRQLAGEHMTKQPADSYINRFMQRGHAIEDEARRWYSRTRFSDVRQVAFVFNPEFNTGWSPDGLVGDEGAIEIKYAEPHVLIAILESGRFPTEHRHQCHGALLFGRRKWVDLVVYSHEQLPKYVARVTPDPVFHEQIKQATETFQWELKRMIERLQGMLKAGGR